MLTRPSPQPSLIGSNRYRVRDPGPAAEALAGRGRGRYGNTPAGGPRSSFLHRAEEPDRSILCRKDHARHARSGWFRPAGNAAMRTREERLRQRFCPGIDCLRIFWICRHCDRGHTYCSRRCWKRTRTQRHRIANRRHQRSPEGRDDHRDRSRVYRARRRLRRVTDHTSPAPSHSDTIDPSEPSPSENGGGSGSGEARYGVHPEFQPACIICGRTPDRLPSRFVGGRPPNRRKL